MGRTLAAFAVAASLLTLASSEASAWVCFATGLSSGGWGRSYDIIHAKLFALRRAQQPASRLHHLVVPSRSLTSAGHFGCTSGLRLTAGGIHFEKAPSIAALTPTSASGGSTPPTAASPP